MILNKEGECRWEKDGTPVGMYKDKYEWRGNVMSGDCTIIIREASVEYDTGIWQCQVTSSDYTQKDTLISKEAYVSIRTPPVTLSISVNNMTLPSEAVHNIKTGEVLDLRCEARGGNPSPSLVWSINNVNTSIKSF